MKAYTDLEQSKKLQEILPLESADMYYQYILPKSNKIEHTPKHGNPAEALEWYNKGYTKFGKEPLSLKEYCIPCWSLAALLQIIPKDIEGLNRLRIDIDNVDFSIWYDDLKGYGVNDKFPDITSKEPLDACVEMILKLHELKLL